MTTLKFYSEQLFTTDKYYGTLREFINVVRRDFKKLTNLTVEMRSIQDVQDYNEFELFKDELYELKETMYYTEKLQDDFYNISFWL